MVPLNRQASVGSAALPFASASAFVSGRRIRVHP